MTTSRAVLNVAIVIAIGAQASACDTADRKAVRDRAEQAELKQFTNLVADSMCGDRRYYALSTLIEESERRGSDDSYQDIAFDIAQEIEAKGCPPQAHPPIKH